MREKPCVRRDVDPEARAASLLDQKRDADRQRDAHEAEDERPAIH
jgi:hypothetical protein